MHEKWLHVRWETPVSDADVLMMKLCCHDGNLTITLDQSSVSQTREDIRFIFRKCPAFRSILEKFKTELCNNLSVNKRLGRTLIVENSPWIAELEASEPMFSSLNKNIRHYVVATDWEVVEILSSRAPEIAM